MVAEDLERTGIRKLLRQIAEVARVEDSHSFPYAGRRPVFESCPTLENVG